MAGVFATAVGVSFLSGQSAVNGCFWAMLVSVIAGIGGIFPFIRAKLSKKTISGEAVLIATTLRMLLVIAGMVIMLLFTKVNVMWFMIWLAIFYVAMLAGEVYYAIKVVNEQRIAKS